MGGVKSDFRFSHLLRVRFAETDMQGIVFNGNYMTYYDVAQVEYFRAVGLSYQTLIEMDADTVLAKMTLEFKSTASFDDLLEVHARVAKIGNSSITFNFEIYPQHQDRLINQAETIYVCVDPKTLKPVRVPDRLRARLSEFEGKNLS